MAPDSGESTAYETGALRSTYFSWNHISKTLSWVVRGNFADSKSFTQITATLLDPQGTKGGPVYPIGQGGTIQF